MADEEVLQFRIDANVHEAQKRITQFERKIRNHFDSITRTSEKMAKKGVKATKALEEANWELLDSLEDLGDVARALAETEKQIVSLNQKKVKARGKDVETIDAEIEALQTLKKEFKAAKSAQPKSEYAKALADPKLAKQMGKNLRAEVKESFKSGVRAFMSKDAKGLTESLGDLIGKSAKIGGLKLGKMGAGLKSAGAAKAAGGGFGGKMMGGAMGGMGKVLGALAKAAPLISTLASVLVKVVTLFIDVEAQAKAFNKGILESASTIEFFNRSLGSSKLGAMELEDTLKEVRDTAHDAMFNLEWGATAETHQAVLNVLNQEGVSLKALSDEAKRTGVSFSHMQKQIVSTSIVYSRAFGLPLQEINQMQAEMFTEMGMSAKDTQASFAHMSRAADEAGISANKFFGMIRGVSQDLSLWGTRMEDAVKLLGRLGKVMNPREAQRFMQTAVQGLKQMGRTDRLRLTLLAGEGKMGKLIEKDIKRKGEGLAKTLGMKTEKLMDIMKREGPKGLEEAIQKNVDKSQQGAVRGAAIEMKEQMTAAGKGVFGKAIAARSLGPGAALEAMKSAIGRFGGKGKSLMEMRGEIGAEMMAENLGVSEEQLSQMVKFEQSMEMYREELKLRLEENKKKAAQGDQAAIAELQRLKEAGVQTAKDIDAKGYDELMDTMTDAEKANAEDQGKIRDFAREQTDLQTSLVDKLGILVDFVINQLYNIMVDIFDMIASIPGVGPGLEARLTKKAVLRTKDPELAKKLDEAGGDPFAFRHKVIEGGLGQAVSASLDKFTSAKTGKEKDEARFGAMKVTSLVDIGMKGKEGAGKAESALKAAGITDPATVKKVQELIEGGKSFSNAMTEAGLGDEKKAEALKKALWFLDPSYIASLSQSFKAEKDPKALREEREQRLEAVGARRGEEKAAEPAPAAPAAAPGAPASADPAAAPPVSAQAEASAKATGESPAATGGAPAAAGGMSPDQKAVVQGINENITALRLPTTDDTDRTIEAIKQTTSAVESNTDILKGKVRLDKSFVTGELGKQIEESVLGAVRVALIEYKLYKDVEMKDFTEQLKQPDFDAKTFGMGLLEQGKEGKLPSWVTSAAGEGEKPTGPTKPSGATGGLILGMNPDGTAKILRPPAGEMPAFVGAGETVVPRGGAGGGVNLTVNVAGVGGRDLARAVEVAATNAIYEYKRREGLH